MTELFKSELKVINFGLNSFSESINENGGEANQVNWNPPAEGDTITGLALA